MKTVSTPESKTVIVRYLGRIAAVDEKVTELAGRLPDETSYAKPTETKKIIGAVTMHKFRVEESEAQRIVDALNDFLCIEAFIG